MKKHFYIVILTFSFGLSKLNAQCYKALDACTSRTAVIKENGTLWMWGSNYWGQQGDGTQQNNFKIPTQVGTDANWEHVSVGPAQTIAIKNDSTLWAWGQAHHLGVDGSGTPLNVLIPQQVGFEKWKDATNSEYHTLAIKADGSLWAWGRNINGILGLGDIVATQTPTRVGTENQWKKVGAHSHLSLALKEDGTLWGWGGSSYRMLGDSINVEISTPIQIGKDHDWVSFSFDEVHICALKSDGSLWIWGYNTNGYDLGLGSSKPYIYMPVRFGKATNWKNVATPFGKTYAINSLGELWHMNAFDNVLQKYGPKQVGTDLDWNVVVSRGLYAVAIKSSDSVIMLGAVPEPVMSLDCMVTAINDKGLENLISVYPNPSNGIFNIDEADGTCFSLIDVFGSKSSITVYQKQLDLSEVPAGIYYLKRIDVSTKVYRLVKL